MQGGGEQHSLGQGEQSGGEANPEQCGVVNERGKHEPVQGRGEQHSHGQGGQGGERPTKNSVEV